MALNKDRDYDIKRQIIKNRFITENNIIEVNDTNIINPGYIQWIVNEYDRVFLGGYIKGNVKEPLKISVSNRMTSSGGKTIYSRCGGIKKIEIRISRPVLSCYMKEKRERKVCGIPTSDLIDGLILILEHELCHMIEFNEYGDSNCKKERFKTISWNLFGHTSSYHEILGGRSEHPKLQKCEIYVGNYVEFLYKGIKYEGRVINVNKRATVMVGDVNGRFKDNQGNRFTKWYVPLNRLAVIEN